MDTTGTLTLTDFLLARYAEDEAVAKAATQGNPRGPWRETVTDDGEPAVCVYGYPADPVIVQAVEFADAEHIARHDPARVLTDIEAKRRIVTQLNTENADNGRRPSQWDTASGALYFACRLLALPYADHPDYDEAWRP